MFFQQTLLGKVRVLYKELLEANKISIPARTKSKFNFLWITDFPLFTLETDEETSTSLSSTHHPFTAPHPEDLHKLETEPLNVLIIFYTINIHKYINLFII